MYDPYPSPLRYPGGKTFLKQFLCQAIQANGLEGGVYVEPFAGGAGAALGLLFSERVSEIHINDIDPCIYAFWKTVLEHTGPFLELLEKTSVTVGAWKKQKSVLRDYYGHSVLEVGFATFFVNRCNRSGVFNAGPIGGIRQEGDYKIDVRFNKERLKKKIEKIALYKERITAWNLDGVALLSEIFATRSIRKDDCLVYMDPPYFRKAETLYSFYFTQTDHERLADCLNRSAGFRWILSYDDRAKVRRLYPGRKKILFRSYSIHSTRIGRELMISSRNCVLPVSLGHA